MTDRQIEVLEKIKEALIAMDYCLSSSSELSNTIKEFSSIIKEQKELIYYDMFKERK